MASRDVLKWKVVVGATDLAQPGPAAEVFQIKQILKHQAYDEVTARNNIALLELDQPVACSDYIQLGCVPDGSLAVPELKTCYIAGWRATPDSAPSPRLVLQEAKVRLIDVQLCNSSRWYGGAVHPQDLCAGYPRGGIDTCQVGLGPGLGTGTLSPNRAPWDPQSQHRDPEPQHGPVGPPEPAQGP
ncbi:acrosin-like [Motacilla alba alba]|uniref:acrosin-like n=1 Tax=Motacilla alba alba TaxID=1094192 RepID=UPI0018D55ED3|nr:acrosin-like [Motacilla alba alba]